MREFPIEIKLAGLSPKRGSPGAEVMIGLRPIPTGMESVLAPALVTALPSTWPFPQVFELLDYRIVATVDGLYQVDGTPILTGLDNAGYPWDAAIVGDFIVATNNKIVVTGRGYDLAVDTNQLVPAGRSICTAAGSQLVVGAPWAYNGHLSKEVIWSQIGVADFTITEGNTAGRRYAMCGHVLRVFPHMYTTLAGLKYGFIVFGTNKVVSFSVEDHPVMFSQKAILGLGLYSQLAVAGDDKRLFFVGTNRKLYTIEDAKVAELGFDRQLRLAGSEIALSYDKDDGQLWVGF